MSSSDSDDEGFPLAVLLAMEPPRIHALQGGGKAAFLIWITIMWFLLEVVKYNSVTLICYTLIIIMVITYICLTASEILKWAPPWISIFILDSTSNLLSLLSFVACFHQKLYFTAILFLWIVSLIGNYISLFNLIFLGIVCMVTLPSLYQRYEKEVDYLVGIVNQKMMKIYMKFELKFLKRSEGGNENEENEENEN